MGSYFNPSKKDTAGIYVLPKANEKGTIDLEGVDNFSSLFGLGSIAGRGMVLTAENDSDEQADVF